MTAVDRFLIDCASAALDVPLPRYMDWAFDALMPLLRFDSAGWGIGTHAPYATHLIHLRGVPPELMLAYEDGVAELDYIRHAAAANAGVTINDFDIRDGFPEAAAAIDDRISTPFALEQTLATSVPHDAASGLHHFILLWRSRRFDPFNEAERQLVQRCIPHMVAGWRTAQRLALARAAEEVQGHALVDDHGTLHSFDDRFIRTLRRRWPDWHGAQVPAELLAAVRAGPAASVAGLTLKRSAHGPLHALSIAERHALPLTLPPAQRRIAERYAAGASHRAIAAELGLSAATVRNQVQRVFKRLGVSSKLELARRLRDG